MHSKIAIPVKFGKLSPHFGECDIFILYAVRGNSVFQKQCIKPPGHDPGVFPAFLIKTGVEVVIAHGMGIQAMEVLRENEVEVIDGVEIADPELVVEKFLRNELKPGLNPCDH